MESWTLVAADMEAQFYILWEIWFQVMRNSRKEACCQLIEAVFVITAVCIRACSYPYEWQACLRTAVTSHPPHSGHCWFMPFQRHAGSFHVLHCISHCIASLQLEKRQQLCTIRSFWANTTRNSLEKIACLSWVEGDGTDLGAYPFKDMGSSNI